MSIILKQTEASLRYVSYKGVSQRYHLRYVENLILNADIKNNHPYWRTVYLRSFYNFHLFKIKLK
jgi:hypothetical protein